MPDFERFRVGDTTYTVRDEEALHTDDAPNDGKQYARKNGGWEEVTSGGQDVGLSVVNGLINVTYEEANE